MDPQKLQYTQHNAKVYGLEENKDFAVAHSDFLKLRNAEKALPMIEGHKYPKFNAVFVSPPWGGTGYNKFTEYSLDHIYPDFEDIIEKSLEYSKNLILFLPKNTSVDELVERLKPYHDKLTQDTLEPL